MVVPTPDSPLGLGLMVLVGAIAAGVNAVAGGGTLVSFPTLLFMGVPSIQANASNSVALWPGSLSSALAFRDRLKNVGGTLLYLLIPTVGGSLLGAWALARTGEELFAVVVPFLVLAATLLLLFQKKIKAFGESRSMRLGRSGLGVLQVVVGFYGGYFGAGMGVIMLASLGLALDNDIHDLNALKNWLGVAIKFSATFVFIAQGLVLWPVVAALTVGTVVGGYIAARLSLKVASERMRVAIVCYGLFMSAVFFYQVVLR